MDGYSELTKRSSATRMHIGATLPVLFSFSFFLYYFHPSSTVFLCFMYTTLDQQGPGGAPWGFPVYTLHLDSDAGYAVVPLTLLGAPVNIGRALGGLMA